MAARPWIRAFRYQVTSLNGRRIRQTLRDASVSRIQRNSPENPAASHNPPQQLSPPRNDWQGSSLETSGLILMQVTEEQPSTSFPQERASFYHDSNIQLDDDASPVLLGLERDSFHIKKQSDFHFPLTSGLIRQTDDGDGRILSDTACLQVNSLLQRTNCSLCL